jgi:hypothetical protein
MCLLNSPNANYKARKSKRGEQKKHTSKQKAKECNLYHLDNTKFNKGNHANHYAAKKKYIYTYIYPSFYEHLIYGFSLQRSVCMCTYFSLNEFQFRYNEQLTFVSSATFTWKVMGIPFSTYEFSP